MLISMVYYRGGIEIKIIQEKKKCRVESEEVLELPIVLPTCSQDTLFLNIFQCLKVCSGYCQSGGPPMPLCPEFLIVSPVPRHAPLTMLVSIRRWSSCFLKVPIPNHIIGVTQNPQIHKDISYQV